jgi:hypothetical protein
MKISKSSILFSLGMIGLLASSFEARADGYSDSVTAPAITMTKTTYTKSFASGLQPAVGHLITNITFRIRYTTPTYGVVKVRICQDVPTGADPCSEWKDPNILHNVSSSFTGDASYVFYMQSYVEYSSTRTTSATAGGQNSSLSVTYN